MLIVWMVCTLENESERSCGILEWLQMVFYFLRNEGYMEV